jgi:hypothetical protein
MFGIMREPSAAQQQPPGRRSCSQPPPMSRFDIPVVFTTAFYFRRVGKHRYVINVLRRRLRSRRLSV